MKIYLLFSILILCGSAFAQEPVYQSFDVDSAAQPRGGLPYLNTFLQTNLRKPVMAESKGIGGRVIVSGIIEADGRVTDANVIQSTVPGLNHEAVRVFRLFNAWQPAQKTGKAVRQQVSIPVTFNANPPFPYVNGARTSYYDADQNVVTDSSERAKYRQVSPVDSTGIPTGDIVIFQRKRQDWKEYYRLPFVRKKSGQRSPSGKPILVIGVQQANGQWQGAVFDVTEDGLLVGQSFYANGERTGYELAYHPNGGVARRTDYADTLTAVRSWYPNGQIKQIWTVAKIQPMRTTNPDRVTAFWDSTGRPLVTEGKGTVTCRESAKSLIDSTRQTQFTEQGAYAATLKQGTWTGRYADGSFFYEEQYEKGVCQGGRAISAGSDTVRYAMPLEQPEFMGGKQEMGQFLARTLRYPADAQRARAQGKVVVSFIVCTDGTLCDYHVVKGAHPDLDREALRVVEAMNGRWKPGLQRGQKVRVQYNMPINFTLE